MHGATIKIHKRYLDPGTHKNKAEILITIKHFNLIIRALDTQNTYSIPCLYYKKLYTHDVQRNIRCLL